MKPKITKRDILFFLFGIITMITIEVITDWEGHKVAFKEGMENGYQKGYKK